MLPSVDMAVRPRRCRRFGWRARGRYSPTCRDRPVAVSWKSRGRLHRDALVPNFCTAARKASVAVGHAAHTGPPVLGVDVECTDEMSVLALVGATGTVEMEAGLTLNR